MIAELGHFSLILALIAALIQGFLPLAGTALGVQHAAVVLPFVGHLGLS